jgi:dipeptidyl aminopeptidase/acylaminoacyl peptidase
MRKLVLALALLPGLAAAAPARPKKQYTIEQLMKTVRLDGASFSPDEQSVLYSSNETGIFNVYTVPVAGGKATALTKSKTDTTMAVGYFPKDDRILYQRDHGGDENTHLYVRQKDGKEKDLTPGAKVKANFGGWTHDLTGFYVLTNERDSKFFDLYRYDAASYNRELVYQDDVGNQFEDISDDGKWMAFGKLNTTSDSNIYLYEVATKKLNLISKHEGTAAYNAQVFDPASKNLYYLTDDGSEFKRLRRYDLAAGKSEDVEKAEWDIQYTFFSFNGRYRAQATNEDGHTRFKVIDTAVGAALELPKLPDGEVVSGTFSRSEKLISFYYRSDRNPPNLYIYDIAAKKLTRVTDALNKQIDPDDLVDSEVVRFKSFDGLAIPNILYKPHQATPEAKAPALVWVHGGPGDQTRAGYNPLIQYLVNHGYVVLGINNRGSSGYGKTFFTADDRKHGHEPLWDCVEAKKYLQSLPYVDPAKIAIIGGSYGGYMVLAALAFKPDEFVLGVDIFGVANWVRILKSIPPYWESFRQALYAEIGDPEKDEKLLQEISPLFHADQIKKPLLVLQGANDPRVLKVESDDMVAAVKKNKVPVEYVVFPDEGHGFTKTKNQIEGYRKILTFLDKYLRGK